MERVTDWLLTSRRRTGPVLVLSALAPLLVCMISGALRDTVATSSAALLLVLCVVVSGTSGIRVAALVAALASGLGFDYFLTKPYHSLAIADRDDLVLTLLLVVIGGVVTEAMLWGYRQQARAARRSGYLDGALTTAETAARGELSRTALLRLVSAEIADVLGVPSCRYVDGPVHDHRLAVLDHDGVVTHAGQVVDVERRGLPIDNETALVVPDGHFVITSASALTFPTLEQLRVAVLLADLVSTRDRSRP